MEAPGLQTAVAAVPAGLEAVWPHCKELTETPVLTPSGRGSYQISHCEKFDGGERSYGRSIGTVYIPVGRVPLCGTLVKRLRLGRCPQPRSVCNQKGACQPLCRRKLLRETRSRASGTVALPVLKGG